MRLIDVAAWKEAFCEGCGDEEYGLCTKDNPLCRGVKVMNGMPTVDAVEVVRCGECRYYGVGENEEECWRSSWCVMHETTMDCDDYCSYGERKEK